MAYISFRLFLGLLFGIQSWLYAEVQGEMFEKHALIGQQVNLACYFNSTGAGDVTWSYIIDPSTKDKYNSIYTCEDIENVQCEPTGFGRLLSITDFDFQATRSNDTSVLSLTIRQSDKEEHDFKCESGNNVQQYLVKIIERNTIIPHCNVTSPRTDDNGVGSITISCKVNSSGLDVSLTLQGIGLNVLDDIPGSFASIKAKSKTLYFEDFNNIVHNASCNVYITDIDITRSCTYPKFIKARYVVEGNDIIVECDDELDVDHWRFYSSDGIEEDIEDRSWIREGGRSLLIRNISERDVGKVIECRTKEDDNKTNKGTIGFTAISKISRDNNNNNSEGQSPPPSAHNPYLVLMLLFLTLWLITTVVGGVWWGCTPKRNKYDTSAIASASGNASVPNGGSGDRETALLNVVTAARWDPETLNTNNSAHNPAFEPEVNNTGENNRNRQSNNESHLYFTLEKSSPSPVNSLLRASTARRELPDANPASLNHPQSSHSQCYETVGEPNKGATCSYDLGEYAEVGYQIQGKGPPDLGEYAEVGYQIKGKGPPNLSGRPSIRKKPGREKAKENEISSLYSKVNK